MSAQARPGARGWKRGAALASVLALTILTYWPVKSHELLNYDDDVYVAKNPHVQEGLSRESLVWAFTTTDAGNWHPLTWISHMVDYELYGLKPAGHHVSSGLLHVVNVLLLLLVLDRLTGAFWSSVAVSALFAVHPLNVESVAWIAERKNLLCTVFWWLAIGAYAWHLRKPSWRRYLAVAGLFALGLLSKPMAITLPFVLLLLDWWPLGRTRSLRLVVEKIPLFFLAALAGVITLAAQRSAGAVSSLAAIPIPDRLSNAVVSYAVYIRLMVWPAGLAIFYPHPGAGTPWWKAAAAVALLAAVTALVLWQAKRRRYLAVGWLWYLGTLAPVIGIVQVGDQAMADRYGYIPLIGLFIMAVWGVAEWTGPSLVRQRWTGALAVFLVLGWALATRHQLGYWRDQLTVFTHALEVTKNNSIAQHEVGAALLQTGKLDQAIEHFQAGLKISPTAQAHFSMGQALERRGSFREAEEHYAAAIRLSPDHLMAHVNLGSLLYKEGKLDDAITHYLLAIRIRPNALAYFDLGVVYHGQGRLEEAVRCYREALRLDPHTDGARQNLDQILRSPDRQR